MDLLALFQSLESTGLGGAVRQSIWMFPVIQCFHLLGLSLLGGSVLILDLRMLGVGLQDQQQPPRFTTADLARKLQPFLSGALALTVATGILMFLSEAVKCYYSPPFFYKLTLLAIATLYTFTVRRKAALADPASISNGRLKLTALLSMMLWFGVGFSGRWIAFY